MPWILPLLASIFGAGISLVSSSMSRKEQHNNLQMSLNAQKAENEKNREYNLALAQQQNQWNQQQWERENAALQQATADERAYNDPSAQMARLQSAGLNPDMYYGNGSLVNTSSAYGVASSPSMSAGAPSSPMDWSALAGRKTVGDVLQTSLDNRLAKAQIDSIKANTRKTLADAGLSEISLEYEDAKQRLGLDISEQQFEQSKADYELTQKAIEKAGVELENLSLDKARKMIENAYQAELYQADLNRMAEELKITKAQAANAVRYYSAQVLGMEADNAWKDAAWIVEQKDGVATLIKYGSPMFSDMLGNLTAWLNPKSFKKNPGTTSP